MIQVKKIKQFSVFLENKPGALGKFTKFFHEKGVDILALSCDARYDSAIAKVAVTDDLKLGPVLTERGLTSVKSDAMSVEFDVNTDFLNIMTDLFVKEGINITTIYGGYISQGNIRIIVISESNEKAYKILQQYVKSLQ